MARIPVITGFGGINAAGRSSGHHAYRRTVIDALDADTAAQTWASLSALMNLDGEIDSEYIADNTLVRRLGKQYFDPNDVAWNRRIAIEPANGSTSFTMARRNVPRVLPPGWHVSELDHRTVRVDISERSELFITDHHPLEVSAAGQVPSGFDPERVYPSRSHPRGLQLTVYAASDALGNSGLDWDDVTARVNPDQISVYAGSAMSQLDGNSNGGLIASRYLGKRVTSKHVALGLAEMPADFVNAYVLGSMGTTGLNMGACATYLYNMRQAAHDIRAGRSRIAVIGAAEAPLVPEIFDGYSTMRALATDRGLLQLDAELGLDQPDWRRACRPFADNCGFTLAEGAQFTILMDDELALELGAECHGSVADVFVNADGFKKSISAPGVGNYLTFARAVAVAQKILGDQSIRQRSFVQAHGTGTPANRRTESRIFNETARAFGIEEWPVAAIKCFLGHTMAVSGGDQLASTLGVWHHGIIPGISTLDAVAEDVADSHLDISAQHKEYEPGELDVAFINAKGFGGNNATAAVLSSQVTTRLLQKKHGAGAITAWQKRAEVVRERSLAYDSAASAGSAEVIYRFDHQVRDEQHIHIDDREIVIDGLARPISLDIENPFDLEL